MKSINLDKYIALSSLVLSIFCCDVNALVYADFVGTEICPPIEQMRSGSVPGWYIMAPNGISKDLTFVAASITNSSFAHEPYVRCIYEQKGKAIEAKKQYYGSMLRYDQSKFQSDPEHQIYDYICKLALPSCTWDVLTVTYDNGPFH